MESTKKILYNESALLEVDLNGGAITSFHLKNDKINPLSFRFSKEQMPFNNREGAPYQGHFVCLGRWGEPSAGEKRAGLPDHGQIANMLWQPVADNPREIKMTVNSPLEGLRVDRTINIDNVHPVYRIHETVTNVNPLGRLYNIVQHPTIAAPFLDKDTIINCNASTGFNYNFSKDPGEKASRWPEGITDDSSVIDISSSAKGCSSVFSFIVKPGEELGWVTAYSPGHDLLFGYLWKRSDYPWINLWQDWQDDAIRYRGLEFGTTGIHKPFHQILEEGNSRVMGESTLSYIDSGQETARSYVSFLYKVRPGFVGVDSIHAVDGSITMRSCNGSRDIYSLNTTLSLFKGD